MGKARVKGPRIEASEAKALVDAGEAVVRVWPALQAGNTLNSGSRLRVTFTATGAATGFNETLRLCDARGAAEARAVTINAMGRSYVKKGTASCP